MTTLNANRIEKMKLIPLKKLKLNDLELHKKAKGIKAFQESLKITGLLDPITVRHEGNKYLVVDGVRRLLAWENVFPNQPIPCNILNDSSDNEECSSEGIDSAEQMKLDAYTINLARAKVPTKKVEEVVWEMHKKGIGYETIANCFGYKKAGIQKMINRLKIKHGEAISTSTSSSVPTKKQTLNKINRVRTQLENLSNELDVSNEDDKKLFDEIGKLLKAHADIIREEMDNETSPAQDATDESAVADTTEVQTPNE